MWFLQILQTTAGQLSWFTGTRRALHFARVLIGEGNFLFVRVETQPRSCYVCWSCQRKSLQCSQFVNAHKIPVDFHKTTEFPLSALEPARTYCANHHCLWKPQCSFCNHFVFQYARLFSRKVYNVSTRGDKNPEKSFVRRSPLPYKVFRMPRGPKL